jgi:hypothetical protein
MADSDVRERFGQSHRAGRTSFDLVPSKLRRCSTAGPAWAPWSAMPTRSGLSWRGSAGSPQPEPHH